LAADDLEQRQQKRSPRGASGGGPVMDRGPSAGLLGCWMAIRHNGDSRTTGIDLILPDTLGGAS
jgi:hypothetical protein